MNTHGPHARRRHAVLAACVLVLPLIHGCQRDTDRPPMLTEGAETPSATADSGALVTQRTMTSDSLQVMSVGGPAPFVADSDRRCEGEAARDWMARAQAFAGPPTDTESSCGAPLHPLWCSSSSWGRSVTIVGCGSPGAAISGPDDGA